MQQELVDNLPYTMTSSMFHDLQKGNRIEIPWLGGGVVSLVGDVNISGPVNTLITTALSRYVSGRAQA